MRRRRGPALFSPPPSEARSDWLDDVFEKEDTPSLNYDIETDTLDVLDGSSAEAGLSVSLQESSPLSDLESVPSTVRPVSRTRPRSIAQPLPEPTHSPDVAKRRRHRKTRSITILPDPLPASTPGPTSQRGRVTRPYSGRTGADKSDPAQQPSFQATPRLEEGPRRSVRTLRRQGSEY